MSEPLVDRSLLPWTSQAILHAQDVLERELGRTGDTPWRFERDALIDFGPHDAERCCFVGWLGRRRVPEWVCAIATPSSAAHDRVYRMRSLAKLGVAHYWIADVSSQTLECFRLSGEAHGEWIRTGAYTTLRQCVCPEPFRGMGFVLDVEELFVAPPAAEQGGAR